MSVNIDDQDPAVVYSGSWEVLMNSPQEFDGGVHSTTQTGASATITFTGTRIVMYCTVPIGNGAETVDMNFDGQTGSLTRHSHTDTTYYKDNWFDSGPVSNSEHVLIVSNGGGASDTPFQLDYFSVQGVAITPGGGAAQPAPTPAAAAPPAPPPSPTSNPPQAPVQQTTTPNSPSAALATSTGVTSSGSAALSSSGSSSSFGSSSTASSLPLSRSGTPATGKLVNFATMTGTTVTALQTVTTTNADGSVVTYVSDSPASTLHNSSPKIRIGAIIGAAIGGLLLILLLLLFLCLRRRQKQKRHVALAEDSESDLNPRPRNTTTVTPFQLAANRSPTSASPSETALISDGMEFTEKSRSASPALNGSLAPTSALAIGGPRTSYGGSNFNEKDPDFLNATPTLLESSTSPPRIPEIDAGPYAPHYLSDIPPSYQSVRNNS